MDRSICDICGQMLFSRFVLSNPVSFVLSIASTNPRRVRRAVVVQNPSNVRKFNPFCNMTHANHSSFPSNSVCDLVQY